MSMWLGYDVKIFNDQPKALAVIVLVFSNRYGEQLCGQLRGHQMATSGSTIEIVPSSFSSSLTGTNT